ncbi:hypothetical protein JAAARDRAFT_195186 [Jaapia argillacea MUCL 33604]|uniref:Uncharacterized protein n=1 Tax=Jaapia argillacea MUCL 33604 TaxID=933084 RepID=A0A067Q031_9AGAM|nr:hypothetical protein JAAARDRAFT_195186 [Jaapia argillacea MUCL 33604]
MSLFPVAVDPQARAVELAKHLASLVYFLEAAQELLKCGELTQAEFSHQAKKIVTLIEIARATLTRAGIKLYTFTSCPDALTAYKVAYFELLKMLQAQRIHIHDPVLRRRADRLLFPLSSRFVIGKDSQPSRNHSANSPRSQPFPLPRRPVSSPQYTDFHFCAADDLRGLSSMMPPPDAFPRRPPRSEKHITLSIPEQVRELSRSPLRRPMSQGEVDDAAGDDSDIPYRPPPRRKFGIFCTAKSPSQFSGGGQPHVSRRK